MTTLTPEQRAYKERTISQLAANFKQLEGQIEREKRAEVIEDLHQQLEDIQTHLALLQQEVSRNEVGEPVADNLYRRIATTLTNGKFFLAKKLIHKLETIEPFYPGIERLQADVEAGRASRRTQAISKGGDLPEIVLPPEVVEAAATAPTGEGLPVVDVVESLPPKWSIGQLFQFHIVASCLVVSLIACVMFGLGGLSALQWLIEGN